MFAVAFRKAGLIRPSERSRQSSWKRARPTGRDDHAPSPDASSAQDIWAYRYVTRVNLADYPNDVSPSIRPLRQEVDDVGPALTVLVAVSHQVRGDRGAVSLVAVCRDGLRCHKDLGDEDPLRS
jgi:hypothetical protein